MGIENLFHFVTFKIHYNQQLARNWRMGRSRHSVVTCLLKLILAAPTLGFMQVHVMCVCVYMSCIRLWDIQQHFIKVSHTMLQHVKYHNFKPMMAPINLVCLYMLHRFKPPPPNSRIGWRVEFRPTECQLTDFENAALTVFVVMLTRVILSYNLNMLIPISNVDENIKRAQKRDAVLNQR